MHIDYTFVSESASAEAKHKQDVISYAGKLIEIVGSRTLIVGLDNLDRPFVLECGGRLSDALGYHLDCE